VFPGTFDPLTVGHLAVAQAAHDELGVDVVELVISDDPIGKSASSSVRDRLAAVERHRGSRPWLAGRRTTARLLADIAEGADVLVVGADKWHQLHDPSYYGGVAARDAALARLPRLAVAPRAGVPLPDDPTVHVLGVPPEVLEVSSTAVRDGRADWRA
jgi:nicotinic acid mononucleotide adenylyltransferase